MTTIVNNRARFCFRILLVLAGSAASCPTGWTCASDTALAQGYKTLDSVGYVVEYQGKFPGMTLVFTTQRHGQITIDDLIDKIDSVLDGRRRKR